LRREIVVLRRELVVLRREIVVLRREIVVLRREFIIADMSGGVDQWLALARWGFNGFIKKRTVWWANLTIYSTFLYFLVFVFFFKSH